MTRPDPVAASPLPASTSWSPALEPADATVALQIARDVGRRLADRPRVEDAVRRARALAGEPRLMRWRPEGLWQGYAGLALLSATLDRMEPDAGWDVAGHDQMRSAASGLEARVDRGPGFAAALRGVDAAAHALSRDGSRYPNLIETLDSSLSELASSRANAVIQASPHGVAVSTYDVIGGLAGVGRQLLAGANATRDSLLVVLSAIVGLAAADARGIPHWYTPAHATPGGYLPTTYPAGHLNLGLAHGIPGPLALMSLALTAGVEVPGQREAIHHTADAIVRARLADDWGVTFPIVDGIGDRVPPPSPGRNAWCYGSPGVARSLWLAGTAVDRDDLHTLAVETMMAVIRRPVPLRRIDSPTLCHGIAGLLVITARFAADTGMPEFTRAATDLTDQLVTELEPDSTFGFRNLEPTGGRIDHPGLLDGAAGVALALLAVGSAVAPSWDQVLLLS